MRKESLSRIVSLLFALTVISGCADTHEVVRARGTRDALDRSTSLYVARPADGVFGKKLYTNSGAMVAQKAGAAFSPYVFKTVVASNQEATAEALESARNGAPRAIVKSTTTSFEKSAMIWTYHASRLWRR